MAQRRKRFRANSPNAGKFVTLVIFGYPFAPRFRPPLPPTWHAVCAFEQTGQRHTAGIKWETTMKSIGAMLCALALLGSANAVAQTNSGGAGSTHGPRAGRHARREARHRAGQGRGEYESARQSAKRRIVAAGFADA